MRMARQFWTGFIDMLEPMRGLGFQAFVPLHHRIPTDFQKQLTLTAALSLRALGHGGTGKEQQYNNFLLFHKK